jgi:hypothetical protein
MLLGNRSVLLKSPGRFLSGTIASSERSNFFRPGNYRSAAYEALSAIPYGYVVGAWHLPKLGGAVSSTNNAESTSTATGTLAGGKAVAGTAASTSTATGTGQLISAVSGTAASTSTATLDVYATKALSGTAASTSTATLVKSALAWATGTAASTSTATLVRYATGNIAGESTTATPLSPQGLADAVAAIEIEGTDLSLVQALRAIAAAASAKVSGAATSTIVYRNAVADNKDRITATVDADGNRSAITYDLD